jgi:hypothetical protein
MKKYFQFLSLVALTILASSCERDPAIRSYPFLIQVTTAEGFPVQNARVEATAPVPQNVLIPDFEGVTDEFGFIRFEYNYEAVLKIQATRGVDQQPSWIGCGFVKLEENNEVLVRIILRPFNPDIGGC